MDASDFSRRNQQLTEYNGFKVIQSIAQPTVPFSTLCTFNASTVVKNFTSYESYNNITQGLFYSVQ